MDKKIDDVIKKLQERIVDLEARLAAAEARIVMIESRQVQFVTLLPPPPPLPMKFPNCPTWTIGADDQTKPIHH